MTRNKTLKIILLFAIPVVFAFCCGHNSHSVTQGSGDHAATFPGAFEGSPDQDTLIDQQYLLGKFNPETHPLFVRVNTLLSPGKDSYLRKEVSDAFERMHQAAANDGVKLWIVSSTRNFDAQKEIWEAKWNGKRKVDGVDLRTVKDPVERARIILKYSSMPGTSRHHWGTDIDINSVEPSYFSTPEGIKVYNWLSSHARDFGFCQTYTPKDSLRPTGYEEEPWHWSYLPLSSTMLHRYIMTIQHSDIKGFDGDNTVQQLHVIRDYVQGINPHCR